jgi:uncharacterized protein YaiL (DUF2058 family)
MGNQKRETGGRKESVHPSQQDAGLVEGKSRQKSKAKKKEKKKEKEKVKREGGNTLENQDETKDENLEEDRNRSNQQPKSLMGISFPYFSSPVIRSPRHPPNEG